MGHITGRYGARDARWCRYEQYIYAAPRQSRQRLREAMSCGDSDRCVVLVEGDAGTFRTSGVIGCTGLAFDAAGVPVGPVHSIAAP